MGVDYSLVCKASKVFFDLGKLRAHAQFEAEDMREFLFTHTGPFELVNDTWWDSDGYIEWAGAKVATEADHAAHDERVKLRLAFQAATRLLSGDHFHWSNAGGENECKHGYAAGIPCPQCDKITVEEMTKALK